MAQEAVVLPQRDVGGFTLWGHERGMTVDLLGAGSARPTLAFFVDTGDNGVLVSSSSPPPDELLEATLRLSRRMLLFLHSYTSRANGW